MTTSFGEVEIEFMSEEEFYEIIGQGYNAWNYNKTSIGYFSNYVEKKESDRNRTYSVWELGKRSVLEICEKLNCELIEYGPTPVMVR